VNSRTKLLASILVHPLGVRFADACKAAQWLGFIHQGGAGSHRAYARDGEPVLLVFQNRGGTIPAYQARQLATMIDKYRGLP